MNNLSDIATFVSVVEQGSFTAAADHLEMSKAVVSKYISRLESRLGSRLFNRTTRRLTLTESGRVLYERTSAAIQDLASAEAEVMQLAGEPRGRLRITAPVLFGEEFLVGLFDGFCNRYPEIELDVDLDNRMVDLVKEEFDVGIRIASLPDSSMVARRLSEIQIVTVASPQYLDKHGVPSEPADLRNHQCLLYGLQRIPHEWRFKRGSSQAMSVRVKGSFRSNNDAVLKRAALDGKGFLRFPKIFIADELERGDLVTVLESYEIQTTTLSVVFPTRRNMAPKVRVFVEYLAEVMQARFSQQ